MDDFELEFIEEFHSDQEIAQNQQDKEKSEWENYRHNYYGLSLFDFI